MERDNTRGGEGGERPASRPEPDKRGAVRKRGPTDEETREERRQELDEELDEELKQTFPASDPIPPKHVD